MKNRKNKCGFTLVEVVIASAVAIVAASVVFTEMVQSYHVFMYARARLEAQGIAFDTVWDYFYRDYTTELRNSRIIETNTPEYCMFSTNGLIRTGIIQHGNYADIIVQVWPSPVYMMTPKPAAEFKVRRYDGVRRRL